MSNDDIAKTARDRMSEAVTADQDNREDALNDLEFASGKQWPEDEKNAREADSRPCPTINRMPRFIRQVTGDIRKLNPALKIRPADGEATDDSAEIIEGLVRRIEQDSKASKVYEGAAESAAQCGMGAFRIVAEYEDEVSFDQIIKIKRIHNPMSVYWDPQARESTREDAKYCFITKQMTAEDFKEQYPKASTEDADHDGNTDGMENWHQSGKVVVAEYFYKEPVKKKIGLMATGEVIESPTAAHNTIKVRTVDSHKVMWCKVNGTSVIEGPKEFPCSHIPVVAVVGEEMHVGDRVVRTSVIRFAKDPQMMYNYYAATQTETLSLQPKAPYMVTTKQIAGLESIWNKANSATLPYLVYNHDDKAGSPRREAPPVISSGMQNEMARAEDDMKATTGIYDAALGGRSNEQSGIAIRQRQLESDISTSIYTDNLENAIEHCGKIVVAMIPKIYDTKRQLRIIGDDDQEKDIEINQRMYVQGGVHEQNMVTKGKHSVRVSVGPNYSTRRQETAESMMQFVTAFPPAGQVAGDLIAKSMDWPDADKLAARLKKILPPGMISPDEMEPEEQQAMQQQQQQAQQQEQQQVQLAQIAQQMELRMKDAEAQEAEADADKAGTDAMAAKFELALKSGELNGAIEQMVQQQVLAVLQQGFVAP